MSGYQYLSGVPEAWNIAKQYYISPINGSLAVCLGYVNCPMVTDRGALWVASGSINPVLGVRPANDANWTLVQTGVVYNSADPAVTNDKTQGYAVGTLWINTTSHAIYYCSANTTGAAIWTATTA